MLNIGLTGGIGSGKSTVAGFFREKGAYIIDFDALAHKVEEPNSPAWIEIVEHYGTEILNEDKTINREKLGNIVFQNREKLEKLNSIVHPAVFKEWIRQMEDIKKEKEDAIIISDIPLLIEVGLQNHVDLTVLVYISQEEQIKRIMERNGFTRKEAEYRLNSQMKIDEKVPFADIVINNEGPPEETKKTVDKYWSTVLEKEKEKRIKEMKNDR
jgi:dephospho-CoA kinase